MKRDARRARQSGVGLIEVLVAVLVLSIGFLGVAAMEARSLSTNNSAMARSMATISSYSILDAMRADIDNAKVGKYNVASLSAASCPAAGATLASLQLNLWCGQLAKNFGATASTTGAINCSATGLCTITISYDDSRAGWGSDSTQKAVTKGML